MPGFASVGPHEQSNAAAAASLDDAQHLLMRGIVDRKEVHGPLVGLKDQIVSAPSAPVIGQGP